MTGKVTQVTVGTSPNETDKTPQSVVAIILMAAGVVVMISGIMALI